MLKVHEGEEIRRICNYMCKNTKYAKFHIATDTLNTMIEYARVFSVWRLGDYLVGDCIFYHGVEVG